MNSSRNKTSFEQDINWMDRAKVAQPSRFQFPLRLLLIACFVSGLMLAASLTVQAGTEFGSTAGDRPNWQSPNSIQNMAENWNVWSEYTNGIEHDMTEASDRQDFADLSGEAYSVTHELIAHMNDQAYPSGSCAQNFYYMWSTGLQHWANLYGALYYNATTMVGEPIDTDNIANEYGFFEEYYFTGDGVPDKCWNKLDT